MLSELTTPALLLDKSVMLRNLDGMISLAKRHGVTLRPHLKTCKSAQIAKLFIERGITCAAVSTLAEAEYFIKAGMLDLQYAVCVSPNKFDHIARLNKSDAKVSVITDSLVVAEHLVEYANRTNTVFYIWIEIDCGGERTGVPVDPNLLEPIASCLLNCSYIQLQGVMTHAGQAYGASSIDEIRTIAQQEVKLATRARTILSHNDDKNALSVSIGSTPTIMLGNDLSGVDEIRPGVFVFQDTFQWQLGVCQRSDIALSVLSTVISVDKTNNRFVIDAGGLALSKDRSTANGKHDFGFGLVINVNGSGCDQTLIVYSTHQEHGLVTSVQPIDFSKIEVGSRVRILPNHACMTAAAYNGYHVFEDSQVNTVEYWDRVNGW